VPQAAANLRETLNIAVLPIAKNHREARANQSKPIVCRLRNSIHRSFPLRLQPQLNKPAVSHPRHGGLVYARRSVREGDRNVTILMNRVIIVYRL